MLLLLTLPGLADVLVNEAYYDPAPEDDEGNEWIELCNNGAESVDISGWTVEAGGQTFEVAFTIGTLSIAPGEYVLVGGTSGAAPGPYSPNLQNGGSETDGIRIVDSSGLVRDTLLYDTDTNENGLVDDLGLLTTAAPDVSGGHSLGRWPDCTDSQVSSADFVDYEFPSPGAANEEIVVDTGDTGDTGSDPVVDCTALADIKINEYLPDPDGSDDNLEWVELVNSGTTEANLSGWTLLSDTSSFDSADEYQLPEGTLLAPGAFLVLGAGGIGEVSLGNATSSADGIQLRCGSSVADTVIYGSSNSDGFVDDSGAEATSLAPKAKSGEAMARRRDGLDTNLSADDFTAASENTPGAPNITPQCDPTGASSLKINEVLYDSLEDDGAYEFVELYNAGAVSIALEGFMVEAAKGSWSENATLPAGVVIAAGEVFVVGAGSVDNQDYSASGLDLGNGTDGDGVRVLDCTGVVLDTVLYGDELADPIEGDGGSTQVVAGVSSGYSIGRYPDGEDADLHTDWHPYSAPSPGELNADPGAEPTDDDTGGGGNGGKTEPITTCQERERADGKGCASLPLPLSGWEVAILALAIRRRRG